MQTHRTPLARLLRALRGDKYMANAYPPAWRNPRDASVTDGAVRAQDNGSVRAAVHTEER